MFSNTLSFLSSRNVSDQVTYYIYSLYYKLCSLPEDDQEL
jgi:hypothetical protein